MTNPQASFLPEDYLRRKADSRALIINLLLFGGMLTVVVGAFVVTNREDQKVRAERTAIDEQYKTEEMKVEQLKVLEKQKKALMDRAEVTASLIERVPRSFLMAELINRMPANVTLTRVDMTSRRVMEVAKAPEAAQPQNLAQKVGLAKPEASEPAKPKPPRLEFAIVIEGLAKDDTEVADFQAALRDCPLLQHVDLQSTGEAPGEVVMRNFKLEADIRPDADVVTLNPLKAERVAADSGSESKPVKAPAKDWKSLFRGAMSAKPTPKQPSETPVTTVDENAQPKNP